MKKINSTVAVVLLLCSAHVLAASPILATPGTLSGYTFFDAPQSSGDGGEIGDEVGTLQRCVYTPPSPDTTVTVSPILESSKDIKVYFRIVGGDGGPGVNGGGGGSSAILKNNQLVVTGPGANGGATATSKGGNFFMKKGDTLRMITGGGGGQGVWTAGYSVGGGGGAGYKGGGGGASHIGSGFTSAGAWAGRGGDVSPGVGGFVPGSMGGTAGSDSSGGIATYPDGSTAPFGTFNTGFTARIYSMQYVPGTGWVYPPTNDVAIKHPATLTRQGSPGGGRPHTWLSGSGGKAGFGGGGAAAFQGGPDSSATISYTSSNGDVTASYRDGYSNTYITSYKSTDIAKYDIPDYTMELTRKKVDLSIYNPSYYQYFVHAGSFPGQIILMYQAKACTVFQ